VWVKKRKTDPLYADIRDYPSFTSYIVRQKKNDDYIIVWALNFVNTKLVYNPEGSWRIYR